MLAPLGNNGGPTETMALLRGSPAINAGNNALIPAGVTTDQRGVGFARIVGGTVDIGAYESPYLSTVTSVSSSVNASTYGQSVTFTATISDTSGLVPTGSVEFYDGSTDLGTGSILSGSGQSATSTFTISTLGAGSHSITAVYTGTGVFDNSTGALSQTVNQAGTTASVVSSVNPSEFGQSVTFTADVDAVAPGAGVPTGQVTFYDGTTAIDTATLVNGSATFTTSTLAVGSHSIIVQYGGDSNFIGSNSTPALSQTVNLGGSQTSLQSSENPSIYGDSVTFTATVSPTSTAPGLATPTGQVEFFDGSTLLDTETLSGGTASFTTSTLAVGANHRSKRVPRRHQLQSEQLHDPADGQPTAAGDPRRRGLQRPQLTAGPSPPARGCPAGPSTS